jgi:hypothetical protein
MKILSSALIAAALVAVSAHSDRLFGPVGADAPQSMRLAVNDPVVQQAMPGECCNDDFRQALPLWESPIDSAIAKP